MPDKIEIYYDVQDRANVGWTFKHSLGHAGIIRGAAADVLECALDESDIPNSLGIEELAEIIGYLPGDDVVVTFLGSAKPRHMGAMLETSHGMVWGHSYEDLRD